MQYSIAEIHFLYQQAYYKKMEARLELLALRGGLGGAIPAPPSPPQDLDACIKEISEYTKEYSVVCGWIADLKLKPAPLLSAQEFEIVHAMGILGITELRNPESTQ